jgi:intron-binding protein aquarius
VAGTSAAAGAARVAYRRVVAAAMAGVACDAVSAAFPFGAFFAPLCPPGAPLFPPGADGVAALASAEACFAHLAGLFAELASYRAFELLRTQRARSDYMLTKQARLVAMTCTHASLARSALLALGFTYDTLVMEEAGQVTEADTLVPMLLQAAHGGDGSDGVPRLKRVILIGDHHQLPPVVQCTALQRVSHLDQSMFARLVRLGVPRVTLNAQGRMRPALARLFNWRYAGLGDLLPALRARPAFACANAGMGLEAQLIDVPDYGGVGESTPLPHFYQVRVGRVARRRWRSVCACARCLLLCYTSRKT